MYDSSIACVPFVTVSETINESMKTLEIAVYVRGNGSEKISLDHYRTLDHLVFL